MKLGWSDVELILSIVDSASLSSASTRLGVSQSTVTRRLEELEQRVGERLFLRTSRGVRPTPVTLELVPLARQGQVAVRAVNSVLSRHGDAPNGRVRVSTIETLADRVLVPALSRLWERAPQLELELLPSGATARLLELEADIGLRVIRPTEGDLLVTKLVELELVAFASSSYLERAELDPTDPLHPRELDWLNWSSDMAQTFGDGRWVDDVAGARVRFRSSSARTLLSAALDGAGVLLLPHVFEQQLEGLVRLTLENPPHLSTTLWMVRPSSLRDDVAVRCVAGWIREEFDRLLEYR